MKISPLRRPKPVCWRRGVRAEEAKKLREYLFNLANENEMNRHGYQLLGQNKVDETIKIFKKNVKDYSRSWNGYKSLKEV